MERSSRQGSDETRRHNVTRSYCTSVDVTLLALQRVKTNLSTGPDDIPTWVLKDHANILAAPLTAIFNSSLREGVIPNEWKMANVIPLPKTKPMISVETDIRPISRTPIVAKVCESIVLGWVDDIVGDMIDDKQFGGVGGTSTTDALVEMTHNWYEATDVLNNYVRVVLLDFSKAFDLINHHILVDKRCISTCREVVSSFPPRQTTSKDR